MNFSRIASQSLLGRLARIPLRLIPANTRLPILQGKLRGKRWIAGSGNHGCWLGSFEYHKRILFEQTIGQGKTVYDLGAHAGFYTMLASLLVGPRGKVVAFEPVPQNIAYLLEHLRLNRITNVRVIEAAVAERCGQAKFREPNSQGGSFVGRLDDEGTLPVRVVALDPLVGSGELPVPDFLKIDVEGAEVRVLEGAAELVSRTHPGIFLATHGADLHRRCLGLLTGWGYRLLPIGGQNIESCQELLAVHPK